MDRPIESLINDYLAPEQPDDCREASRVLLAEALKSEGPTTHRGQVVTLGADGSIDVAPAPIRDDATSYTDDGEQRIIETVEDIPPAADAPAETVQYVTHNPASQEG